MLKELLVSIVVFATCSPIALSEEKKDDGCSSQKWERAAIILQHSRSHRRNAPVRYCIMCTYCTGHISFRLLEEIQTLQICLGDEMLPICTGYVNKDCPEMDIPPIVGELSITCEDDLGRKYTGTLYFND